MYHSHTLHCADWKSVRKRCGHGEHPHTDPYWDSCRGAADDDDGDGDLDGDGDGDGHNDDDGAANDDDDGDDV